jgi:23S rRNA pseudouridine1911/1915/1917 synthase
MPAVRLDTYLVSKFPVASRGALQRLIIEGHILVDGKTVKPTHHPKAGEVICVTWPEPKSDKALPEDIPLDILYEDRDLVVVNKSPNLVVHPASGSEKHTLVNALLHHCEGELSGIGGVARPGIVHRLDKDTSGCIVVAKNDPTHIALSDQFKARQTRKIYHCLTTGCPSPSEGEINAAIARHPNHRKVMAVSATQGKEARTSYRVLNYQKASALVEARIHTGRTHQIRVHFKYIGHPLVGDDSYGKRECARLRESSSFKAERQMLHAFELTFIHPTSGEELTVQAPWPTDFRNAVVSLGGTLQ